MVHKVAQYPLVATAPLTMGACMALSVLVFCLLVLLLYRKSNTELTMLHRIQACLRILVVAQTVFTATAVALLSSAVSAADSSDFFTSLVIQRQAANVLKVAGATLVAGYAFFSAEHQFFRWLALIGAVVMAGVDGADMLDVGQLIGRLHASKSAYLSEAESTRRQILRTLNTQYAAKVFSFFAWLLVLQIVGCLMNALGWFEINELPDDEEVAGHLKELTRATINRRIQEKHNPRHFQMGVGRRLFKPTDRLEITWDQMVDQAVGRDERTSYPISTNTVSQISPDVQKELCQVLLKMGIKRNQICELLNEELDD